MGTWGTGLYSCDIAEDVKLACNDVFAFYDVKKGNEIILNTFKDVVNQECDDNEAASFWYALADWQWKHGILTEEIRTKALMLLENYTGIKEWETFGNTRDVKQRRVVLDKLSRQLLLRQPDVKLPKATLAKPKHKCGDIIIFKITKHISWIFPMHQNITVEIDRSLHILCIGKNVLWIACCIVCCIISKHHTNLHTRINFMCYFLSHSTCDKLMMRALI